MCECCVKKFQFFAFARVRVKVVSFYVADYNGIDILVASTCFTCTHEQFSVNMLNYWVITYLKI